MIETAFSYLSTVFSDLWQKLFDISNRVPIIPIALGLFLVANLSRFFIMPFLKDGLQSGSDSAKKKGKKRDNG